MATRTFAAEVTVRGLDEPYQVRVHADGIADAGRKIEALVPGLRRVVSEIVELPGPHASSGRPTLAMQKGGAFWAGLSDTLAGPGHQGTYARVAVDRDGDIRVELYAPGIDAPFAPIDDNEEKLALRAAVRTMARHLAFLEAEAVASLVLQTQVTEAREEIAKLGKVLELYEKAPCSREDCAHGVAVHGYDGCNLCGCCLYTGPGSPAGTADDHAKLTALLGELRAAPTPAAKIALAERLAGLDTEAEQAWLDTHAGRN